MTIYTFPEPFECSRYGNKGWAVAYRSDTACFVWCPQDGNLGLAVLAEQLYPPPPIPAAARKPKAGEVWVLNGHLTLLTRERRKADSDRAAEFVLLDQGGDVVGARCVPVGDDRPATPEEAEPFRPLLEGLKASLGEG